MIPVPLESISSIKDQPSFFSFLRNYLSWPIEEDINFEDATFYWDTEEFGYNKNYFRGSSIYQLRPFVQDQPWGIFILHLSTPRIYISELKNILRSLSPSVRKLKDYPTWKPNHLLFICTHDWKNYTFAHFEGDKPQSAKLATFSWEFNSSYLRTVCEYNLSALRMPENLDLFGEFDRTEWIKNWSEAFSIKKVTDKFFEEMKKVFYLIKINYISGIKGNDKHVESIKHSFTQLLINRLLFLKFLEKKGWLFVDSNDSEEERKDYLRRIKAKYSGMNLWREFFYYLFFSGLNNKSYGISTTTQAVSQKIGYVPFLNGGLFEEAFEKENGWSDSTVKVDNNAFDLIFDKLLNEYNFTVEENTPLNIEVALNPDLLGNAYEELISERHGQGAYYTHTTEVELMCKESIKTYLEEHTKVNPSAINKLVYTYSSKDIDDAEAFEIYKLLTKIKILDPAIGSGAYPVKMMQELVQIHQSLAKKIISGPLGRILTDTKTDPENRYQFKLDIIRNNIYGADIDHFAVEIAKLRFWLSLVVDYEIKINSPDDLKAIPALPNLDFKFRTGDSLIAKVKKGKAKEGKLGYNLDLHFKENQPDMFFKEPIRKLSAMKNNFFNYELVKEKRKVTKEQLKKEIEEIEKSFAQEVGITEIETFKGINHILWQIHFAEVYDENMNFGFDICIANPPYLKQEKINELFKTFESGVTKEELVDNYEKLFADKKIRIDKKSDLYVYFFLRGINLLKENGVLCFICSNSWLDVGYGKTLQEVLLKTTRIKTIYDSIKRSFEKADINTTINILVKDSSVDLEEGDKNTGRKKNLSTNNIIRFVAFKDEFQKAALPAEIENIAASTEVKSNNNWRVYPVNQNELFKTTLDEDLKFAGDKWGGKYLRAPDIFFKIIDKAKANLIRLGEIADIFPGCYTGLNDFFYINQDLIKKFKINNKYLVPVLRNTKSIDKLNFEKPEEYFVFFCNDERNFIETNTLNYIKWGEKQKTRKRQKTAAGIPWPYTETVKNRKPGWWAIPENNIKKTKLFMTYVINDRFYCPFAENEFSSDRCYHRIFFDDYLLLAGFLNSTLTSLFINLFGRSNLGQGALKFEASDAKKLLFYYKPDLTEIKKSVEIMGNRLPKPIFEECGFDKTKPIRSQKPNPLPDRKALDDIVFDALGLNKAEREEVYYAVCELVQNRLNKARSV